MSVLEILIAFALLLMSISSVSYFIALVQRNSISGSLLLQAVYQTESKLRAVMNMSQHNFDSITSARIQDAIFSQSIDVINRNEFTKNITVETSSGSRNSFVLSTAITDLISAVGGSTCTISRWGTSTIVSEIAIPKGTPTNLDSRNGFVYVAVNSSVATDTDLYIIDARDLTHPFITAPLNTGPGIKALHVAGHYVYAANTSINAQLQIIDVSDKTHPLLVSSYKLPGTYDDGTTIGNSILYYRSHIYLGTAKSQIAELHDIDVSDPHAPREVGTWEANAAINSLEIIPPYLAVATPLSTELTLLDPQKNLARVDVFDAPGGSGNGKSLSFSDDTLFMGRTVGGNEFYALKWDSSRVTVNTAINLNTSINAVLAQGPLVFLGTSDAEKTFQVWNVFQKSNPVFVNSLAFSGHIVSMDCDENGIFVARDGQNVIDVLKSQ